MMKKDAIFINIGRGHSVDEDALVKALKEKTIGGAFLDVLKHYPPCASTQHCTHVKTVCVPVSGAR